MSQFFFASCGSQVSLLPKLLIPKRREPEVQRQPTENLQVSAHHCWPGAQHSRPLNLTSLGKLQSRLQSPHVPSRGCLPGRGESPAQCSSGQPEAASASLLCCSLDPPALPGTLPAPTHTWSKTGGTLLTHPCSRGRHPRLCSPLVPQAPRSKRYPPVAPSLLQGREHQIAPAEEERLFSQICLHLEKPGNEDSQREEEPRALQEHQSGCTTAQ